MKVLYAWEFGGGLGHIKTAQAMASAYRRAGHHVEFMMHDAGATRRVMADESPMTITTTPKGNTPTFSQPAMRPLSYADTLCHRGFEHPKGLGERVQQWINAFQRSRADVVVLDYAPTGLLAASIAGVRHATIGHGFFNPPRLPLIPGYEVETMEHALQHRERIALNAINAVRATYTKPPLKNFGDFFTPDVELLTTWPELETYPTRPNPVYWGPIMTESHGVAPSWPMNPNALKIFVYIDGRFPALGRILQAIRSVYAYAVVYAPHIPHELQKQISIGDHVSFVDQPADMLLTMHEADIVIHHAGFNTTWEALLMGKPTICFPRHTEQRINVARLQDIRATYKGPLTTAEDIATAITVINLTGLFKDGPQAIADKYAKDDPQARMDAMVAATING